MNLFQWFALPILWIILAFEVVQFLRHPGGRMAHLGRCLIWAGAAITIAVPDLTQYVAVAVGIHRGADLVSYLTTLSLIFIALGFYSRYLLLQRQVTDLVRHLAILEARRHSGDAPRIGTPS